MEFLSLIETATICLFYGFVATCAVMAILYLILSAFNVSVRGLRFYVCGVLLFIMLNIQLSLLIGAVQAKGAIDAIEIHLTQLMEKMLAPVSISATESQYLLDDAIDKNPLLGVFVDTCNFAECSSENIATVMADSLRGYLSDYIWHRVLWSLLLIVLACAIVVLFSKVNTGTAHTGRRTVSSRSNHHRTQNSHSHRRY